MVLDVAPDGLSSRSRTVTKGGVSSMRKPVVWRVVWR
jgi:hypothetical protein